MAGIGDSTLFPKSKMAAAVQLGQSRFRSGEVTSVVPSAGGSGAPTTPLDGLSGVTGAWSASRKLLTSYTANSGALVENISGDAQTLYNQAGGTARDFIAGTSARPTITTSGPNSRAALDFDGTIDSMTLGSTNLANLITLSDGYFIASFNTDRTSSNQPNVYDNDPIFCDSGAFLGVHIKAGLIYGFNWDGNGDFPTAEPVNIGTTYVVEWWHTGGNINFRLNGGATRTVASGNTTALSSVLRVGRVQTAGPSFFDGRLFELAASNIVPASGVRDTLVADFKTWVGA